MNNISHKGRIELIRTISENELRRRIGRTKGLARVLADNKEIREAKEAKNELTRRNIE